MRDWLKEWADENLSSSDLLIILVFFVIIVALLAAKTEIATAGLGSITTYIVKDKAKKTREQEAEVERLRKELDDERRKNDAHLEKEVAATRAGVMGSDLPDLVDSANQRVGGTD